MRTDRRDEANRRFFRNIANTPKIVPETENVVDSDDLNCSWDKNVVDSDDLNCSWDRNRSW